VCGLPAASEIREGGACVGVFAAISFAPSALARPAVRPGPGERDRAGGPGRGPRRVRRSGKSGSGFGGLRPAPAVTLGSGRPGQTFRPLEACQGQRPEKGGAEPRTRTSRLGSRGPRPVPPSLAWSCLGPGRPAGRAGLLVVLVLGRLVAGVAVLGWWSRVSVVAGCRVAAVRVVRGRGVCGCAGRSCVVVVGWSVSRLGLIGLRPREACQGARPERGRKTSPARPELRWELTSTAAHDQKSELNQLSALPTKTPFSIDAKPGPGPSASRRSGSPIPNRGPGPIR
jgi:hypothetical protein